MGFKHGRYLKFGQGNDDHQATAGFNTDASWKQKMEFEEVRLSNLCLLYTSPSPRDQRGSRMPSSA